MKKNLSARLSITVAISMLFLALILSAIAVKVSSIKIEQMYGNDALDISVSVANGINPDEFKSIVKSLDVNSKDYKNIHKILYNTKLETDVLYVYSFIRTAEDEITYIVDGSDTIESGNNDAPGVTADLADYEPSLMKTLNTNKPSSSKLVYSDEYGYNISGYSPIVDNDDKVIGYVGCDIIAQDYYTTLSEVALIIAGTCFIIAAIFSFIFSSIVRKIISSPINRLSSLSSSFKNMDFTSDVDADLLSREDEIGILSNSFEEIRNEITKLVVKIRTASDNMLLTSKELNDEFSKVKELSNNISSAMDEMAQCAMQQALDTESGAEHIETLNFILDKNSNLIRDLIGATDEVDQNVDNGIELMDKINQLNYENTQATKEIFDIVKQTGINTDKITQASNLIANISDKINLLALNTAIESSNSSEIGMKFAIVAEDIRKLAGDSAKSTEVINKIVEDLSKNSSTALEKMEQLENSLDAQNQSFNDAFSQYKLIQQSNSNALNTLNHMAVIRSDLEDNRDNIMQTLEALSGMSEQSAATAQSVSDNAQEQTDMVNDLSGHSENLVGVAEDLKNQVAKFKI
ncbi:methyl-accepting chemotaxis protein [Criibacterium bergeronii]|uniref:Methyl-accepting chemotaxis protein n=1 Tax=Criibacterium bergeronii TaxID=1871336 RepID=A0A552V998_9FIRM|nr:methyl-accepting chemotaxis protein [Criibacterium bergeronii]TRW27044.1 methyl-accepting chemotaxis protein [Criibacterium bergeronii]